MFTITDFFFGNPLARMYTFYKSHLESLVIMKKFFCLLACGFLLFTCTSCGSSESEGVMTVSDNAFSLTPQEFIDKINAFIEEQNDSRYLSIPEYVESGASINIKSIYLTLSLTVDENEKLSEIKWEWDAKRQGTNENMGLYLSATIYMVSPDTDIVETVVNELDMLDPDPPRYDTSHTVDNVQYAYSTFGHAQYNTITITPVSNE